MSSPSTTVTRVCFNSICNNVLSPPRRGWRRRTGEFADLCDRCASAYEEGKFCETFHLSASGWRCCESCAKQIHCGCIVSFHLFVLLDGGGIECITCTRKSFILTPNPAWPPPSLFLPAQPERNKDHSAKNWSHLAGSGPVPWRQAPNLFSSIVQPELQQRVPVEASNKHHTNLVLDNKKLSDFSGRFLNGALKLRSAESLEKGKAGMDELEQSNHCINQKGNFSKNDESMLKYGLAMPSVSPYEVNDLTKLSKTHLPLSTPPELEFGGNCVFDPSNEAQLRNGMGRGDNRPKGQLLSRYSPRLTAPELQHISADPNYVITPLFEKMLSASDAGRIGRLVLPKKCAEAYFPPISHPEGLPLKVQDLQGKEWVFQFRFWPNNSSRMYVLEGVTPCIQAMQLQAGDIVTFSRLGREGKLIMGFRKASNAPNKGNETDNAINGDAKKCKAGEIVSMVNADLVNPASPGSKNDKSEQAGDKSSSRIRRKKNALGPKIKRKKTGDGDLIELKLTWEDAQALIRPPTNHIPSMVIIQGIEFEEYEVEPVIGRPTFFVKNGISENVQWAQCDECFKWRKIPIDALLPSRWTCSENLWYPQRSLCSAPQELETKHLEELLSRNINAASKKMKGAKQDPNGIQVVDGLDRLPNLAILEEGEMMVPATTTQETTKHPRHKVGCTCIVCSQPPSGGPRHKQNCECTVCQTVKRRFQTFMLRREKNKSDTEVETDTRTDQQQSIDEDINDKSGDKVATEEEEIGKMICHISPLKGQIDLNSQPDKDEELSPGSEFGNSRKTIEDGFGFDPNMKVNDNNNSRNRNMNREKMGSVEEAVGNETTNRRMSFGTFPENASSATSTPQ
ncbi:B3 domain-containing protein Os07g0563300-like [Impatiens glandulifera]|uniref:B3 domain-containing protein Os07g0563300-like n=1 Tax=Impatiens glandulifera TaxID=253017 RepID=UPI001FB0EC7B|nr:B3 domain-containing protein Os07g0563300-like [Impatiens glandulifera]